MLAVTFPPPRGPCLAIRGRAFFHKCQVAGTLKAGAAVTVNAGAAVATPVTEPDSRFPCASFPELELFIQHKPWYGMAVPYVQLEYLPMQQL